MDATEKARPAGKIPHTDPFYSKLSKKAARYIVHDGQSTRLTDRNTDTDAKRRRTARSRYESAVKRWGQEATVYEYRLKFPTHMDVLDHDDANTLFATVEALAPDAFIKLEDARSGSPFPTNPHAHFLSTYLLPDMPGLWRHPAPLDLYTVNLSDDQERTVYGFFWYTAKPVLGGAVRPTHRQYQKLRQRFSQEDLVRQHLVAQQRTDAATARAQANGHAGLPDTAGWITGGKKRKKHAA